MTTIERVLAALAAEEPATLQRLFALLRIPSVSMDPNAHDACDAAAAWCAAELQALGFATAIHPTSAHAMVLGHRPAADPHAPHFLFYGHYDVQPAEPLDLWATPPFAPCMIEHPVHGPVIAGRGASDDKGQFMTFLAAIRAWLAATGSLPIALTVLLEGDEEADSGHLDAFLTAHAGALKADAVLICDSEALDAATPAITTSVRGFAGGELCIRAASRDLHSGDYGGAAPNPNLVLARLLASLHDAHGRVTIAGFYDGIAEPSIAQRQAWQRLGFDPEAFLAAVGLKTPAGEQDRAVLEQVWTRPTAEVNGYWGGYTGPGVKTVIPAEARAKLTFRLVAGQNPQAIMDGFEAHLRSRLPADCTLLLERWDGTPATVIDPANPLIARAGAALQAEWGVPPAILGSGGSIPIVSAFKERLGMESLMVGFALEDDNAHAPNEKYNLASFRRGCRSWARIIGALA